MPARMSSRWACRSRIRSRTALSFSARPSARSSAGTTLRGVLAMIEGVRESIAAPIVVLQLRQPAAADGRAAFAGQAASAGVDGVLALDLPIEEAGGFRETLRSAGHRYDLPAQPDDDRCADSSERPSSAAGFLYGISRLGVTGARDQVASAAPKRSCSGFAPTPRLPIALGFGISRPEHVADGVRLCGRGGGRQRAGVGGRGVRRGRRSLIDRVEDYVRWLKGAGLGAKDYAHTR